MAEDSKAVVMMTRRGVRRRLLQERVLAEAANKKYFNGR